MKLPTCPKCDRPRRIVCRLEKQKGKKYWIERCIKCNTPITLEPFENHKTDFKIDQ